jgi:phosphoglycolate/pyridoxal phosphate phosphatase family enzyme
VPLIYVFDLDGVLWRGDSVVPGAPEAIARLRAEGKRLYFLTNNSSQPRRVYVEKLTRLGIPAQESEIATSASITAAYLTQQGAVGKTVFAVGGPGIHDELGRVGISVVSVADPEEQDLACDYVVVGLDKDFRYETLRRAQQCLLRGATFIATNRDGQYPVEQGVIPGGGSIVAAIATAAEREPLTMGKPEPLGLQLLLQLAGVAPEDAVMVGDRLDTDILCGNRCGVPTALVLTGVGTREQAAAAPPELAPTRVIATLAEL